MCVLVTGITGQLGYEVLKCLKERGIPCVGAGRAEFDLTQKEAVMGFFEKTKPTAVIHCASYTNVNQAESEAELCKKINGMGTEYMVEACRRAGAKLLYISTEYVFAGEGDSFYETDAQPAPLNVYGRSKLDGELAVKKYMDHSFIVRISWGFGKNGNNFVKTMLKLGREKNAIKVVADQIGSPTYMADLAPLLCDMIGTEKYGIYHATNEGVCSFAEFAQEIMRQAKLSANIIPITAEEYQSPAVRPKNSRLSKTSLDQAGFSRLPDWKDALSRYLKEIGE